MVAHQAARGVLVARIVRRASSLAGYEITLS
jgi:hypothetical protein